MSFGGFYRLQTYAVMGAAALLLLYLVLPTLVIVPLSFNDEPYFTYPIARYSLRWYAEVLGTAAWRNALWNSLMVASAATAVATVVGTMAALGLARLAAPIRRPVFAVVLSPLVIPIIVFALGFYYLSARAGLVNSLGALVWAHSVLGLPFVIIVVAASLERFDRDLIRAAQSLGATPVETFRRVTLPLLAPGVVAGAIFAFVCSWDEVVVALFVAGGPENHTLPRRLWSGLREELSPAIIAVATLLSIMSVLLMIAVEVLRRRGERLRARQKE